MQCSQERECAAHLTAGDRTEISAGDGYKGEHMCWSRTVCGCIPAKSQALQKVAAFEMEATAP